MENSIFISVFVLSLLAEPSYGTEVGFSCDGRSSTEVSLTVQTISFLKQNQESPTLIKVFVADHKVLNDLSDKGITVGLYLNKTGVASLIKSQDSANSWVKAHIADHLSHINVTSIIIGKSVTQGQLPLLLSILKLIHSALRSFDLQHSLKVSIEISLSDLQKLPSRFLRQITNSVSKSVSYIMLETEIKGELSMGDQFIKSMIKKAKYAAAAFSYTDILIILNVKSDVAPSASEVSEFVGKVMTSLQEKNHTIGRISEILTEITPMQESTRNQLKWEEEQIFRSTRRELLNNRSKVVIHDFTPLPMIVTVPSANPTTDTTPVTIPIATPVGTTTPLINPPTQVTNPVTTPTANPVTPPSTNTPISPPMANPVTQPTMPTPVTTPTANPIPPPATTTTPTSAGQSWCVAKQGASESALQVALDYACGQGGADCSAIQPTGSCYNPNTAQNHASYAFNSYYQKNPEPTSCDFKGVATIVNANPSTPSCIYPSSSQSSASVPASSSTLPPPPPVTNSDTPPTSLPPPVSSLPPPMISSIPPPTTSALPPPITSILPPPTTSSPPLVLNSTFPFSTGPPPTNSVADSPAAKVKPLFIPTILAIFIATGKLVLDIYT